MLLCHNSLCSIRCYGQRAQLSQRNYNELMICCHFTNVHFVHIFYQTYAFSYVNVE